jgi:hypothetical protein
MQSVNHFVNPATSSQLNPPSTSHSSSSHGAAAVAASLLKVNASYDTKKLSSLYASYDYRVLGRQNNHTHHSPYYNSVFLQKLDQELSKLELINMPKPNKYSLSLQQEHAPSILKQNVLNENFNVTNNFNYQISNGNANRSANNNTPNASNKKEAPDGSNKSLPKVENRFRGASNVKAVLNETAGKNAKTAAFIVDLNRIKKFGQISNSTINET